MALPVLIHTHKAIRAAHVEILSGSAATGAVFAELFMIKSLLVFNPKAKATTDESGSPRWNTSRVCAQRSYVLYWFYLLLRPHVQCALYAHEGAFAWFYVPCTKKLHCSRAPSTPIQILTKLSTP